MNFEEWIRLARNDNLYMMHDKVILNYMKMVFDDRQEEIDTLETRLKLVKDLLNTEQKVRHQTNW